MSGLLFKHRRIDSERKKNPVFTPVKIPSFTTSGEHNEWIQKFSKATSIIGQEIIFEVMVNTHEGMFDTQVLKFFIIVFLEAVAEHPIKYCISSYVKKYKNLHKSILSILASEISARISAEATHYKEYAQVVHKVATCIDIDLGVAAMRIVQYKLATYLKKCLDLCMRLLISSSLKKTLTATEEIEIDNVCRDTVRLMGHIIQTANDDNLDKLKPMFATIRQYMDDLITVTDISIDTKLVCGKLFMLIYIAKNGPDSWINVFDPTDSSGSLPRIGMPEAAVLSLYSALITVVPLDKLESVYVNGFPGIVKVLSSLVDIDKRTAIKSVKLAVARTVCQICNCLEKITVVATGRQVVELIESYVSDMDDIVEDVWTSLKHVDNYHRTHLEKRYILMPVNDTPNAGMLMVSIID